MKRFTSDLTAGGAGPDVVRLAAQVARHVLAVAVDAGALKANPASSLRLVRQRKSEMLFLTPEQVEDLAQIIAPPYGTLVRFAAYTGLRAGEIGALRVKRIDFQRIRVEVAEAVSYVAGQLIVGPTKTYANRHVPMPSQLAEELVRTWGIAATSVRNSSSRALRGERSAMATSTGRSFKPAVRAAGLPAGLRFHDLRHTYAAFCIASTADPYAVMRRMGHSSITVTCHTYGHLFPERDAEITTPSRPSSAGVWTFRGPAPLRSEHQRRVHSPDLLLCQRARRNSNPQPSDP